MTTSTDKAPTVTVELLPVEQRHRDAAEAVRQAIGYKSGFWANTRDDGTLVQAFARFERDLLARHREAAYPEGVVEAASRNVYRLQLGGKRLCDALRRIANGCEGRIEKDSTPALIALDALNHKEPDPDWATLQPSTDAMREALEPFAVKIGGQWADEDDAPDCYLRTLKVRDFRRARKALGRSA